MLAACSGPSYFWSDEYARTHPATADLVAASLTQGCPVEGAPANHLRKIFGRPVIRHADDSTTALWRFTLDNTSHLYVVVQSDTVVRWDVIGQPSSRVALRHHVWSINQGKGFPRRVVDYLKRNPDTDPRTSFLLLRACPAPGMTRSALQASWGTPSEVQTASDTARWIYGYGVEGQREIIILVSDTVRAYRSVGWDPGS